MREFTSRLQGLSGPDNARTRVSLTSAGSFIGFTIWILAVAVFGGALVARSVGIPVLGDSLPQASAYSSAIGMTFIVGLCALVAVVTQRYAPARTVATTFAVGGLLILCAALQSGNLQSLVTIVVLVLIAWYTGSAIQVLAALEVRDIVTSVSLSVPLGFAVIGSGIFALSLMHAINTVSLLASAAVILAFGVWAHITRTGTFLKPLAGTTPSLSYLDASQLGICVGAVVFALLAAFSPEVMYDPFRQHLPIAIKIWESGSLAEFPPMAVSRDPILGHALFAIAYGFGGLQAATLMHAVAGLVSIAGVAAGARVVAGPAAGFYAAIAFASMPLLLWEIGHTYSDLFPALFTAGAILALLRWQADGVKAGLLIAGVLCGSGMAAKLTMIWVSLALALAILLIGREAFSWRPRLAACALFALGHVIALPWIIRSLVIAGGLPGKVVLALASLTDRVPAIHGLFVVPSDPGFHPVSTEVGGFGHGAIDLVTVPWSVTFWADRFPDFSLGGGDIGLVLPLLLPFALLSRRSREMMLLWMTALVTYVAWWATPLQITRHLAPTLVVLAILAGSGFSQWLSAKRPPAWSSIGLKILVSSALIGSLVLFANGRFSQVPFDLFVGRMTPDEYVELNIPAVGELRSASAHLAPGDPLLYIGKWGGAQLYTSAQLVNAGQQTQESLDEQFGKADTEVLAVLDSLGTSQILWDRSVTKPEDWPAHLVSLGFLSRNAQVLDFSNDYYLFGLDLDSEASWNTDQTTTMVNDPTFKTIKEKKSSWSSLDRVKRNGQTVTPRRNTVISQSVAIQAGTTYLLVANVACPDLWSRTTLAIRWLDALGNEVSVTSQELFPGTKLNDQFLLGVAPEEAVTGVVEIGGRTSCDFSRADLLEQPTP